MVEPKGQEEDRMRSVQRVGAGGEGGDDRPRTGLRGMAGARRAFS